MRYRSASSRPRGFSRRFLVIRSPVAVIEIVVRRSKDGGKQLASALHLSPVVFVGGATGEADLIMTALVIDPRPGKSVRAATVEELFQQIQWITP